ncbi:hypothetical protein HBB16_21055 [Pseudonocardia sp. MCCB 268]|nr:hypothetical protein [Pseudonocardia cytotoxica]
MLSSAQSGLPWGAGVPDRGTGAGVHRRSVLGRPVRRRVHLVPVRSGKGLKKIVPRRWRLRGAIRRPAV